MTHELAPVLARAIDKRSTEQVYAYLKDLPEKDRKAAFPAVVAYTKADLTDWRGLVAAVAGLALLGCAPTAKRAMAAINRGSLRWERRHIPRRLTRDLLLRRNVPWLAELAGLWAQTSQLNTAEEWLLVDDIAAAAGIEPPQTPGFTRGWIAWIRSEADPCDAIITGSYAPLLLPMLFDGDGMGAELEFTFSGTGFNSALLRLAADDPAIRTMLIDGCLALLLRGGRTGNLRPFVTLHDELVVTPQEVGARVSDYAALVSADLGTVAGMAQRCLRKADEAGLLAADTLIDVAAIIMQRKEKGLIKTQTIWIRQATKRHPERQPDLLALIDAPTRPAPLPVTASGAPLVPEIPPPIATPGELAGELAAMLSGDLSVATMERVLAAVVELHQRDHEALRAAIRPVIDSRRASLESRWGRSYWTRLGTMLFDVLEPPLHKPMWLMEAFGELRADHAVAQPLRESDRSPATLMELRLITIQRYLRRSPVPRLVATPTRCNGHLDPAVLVDRLTQAEQDGWQPWRVDLSQALLRLPREDPGDDVRRRADRLTSPAGQAVARRLREGQADPVVAAYAQYGNGGRYRWMALLPDRRVAVVMEPRLPADAIETALFTLPRYEQPQSGPMPDETLCAAALPSHREAVAAWAVSGLALAADSRGGIGEHTRILPLLAENDGPTGPATQLALVYGMTVPDAADRVAAVDALLAFGEAVDWRAVGAHLGECVSAGSLVLGRAAGVLRDAAEAGAVETAWHICLGALPSLLAAPKPRPGTTDILQLAERCAHRLGHREVIDGLDAVASRGGGSHLVTAARALRDVLAAVP